MEPSRGRHGQGDGAVAGWVGIADSLMGGVIVVLVVAVAAAGQLDTKTKKASALEKMKNSLTEELEIAHSQTKEAERLRDQAEISNAKLQDSLNLAKAELEEEADKRKRLGRQLAAMTEDLKKAQTLNDELTDTVRTVTSQLNIVKSSLFQVTVRWVVGGAQAAFLRIRLTLIETERNELTKQRACLVAQIEDAQEKINDLKAEVERLKRELKKARDKADALDKIAKKHDMTPDEIDKALEQRRFHAKLLGIEGKLDKVAILLDYSGSMKEQSNSNNKESDKKDRWNHTLDIMHTWVDLLDMKECVLIVFSTEVKVYSAHVEDPQTPFHVDEGATDEISPKTIEKMKKVVPFRVEKNAKVRSDLTNIVKLMKNPNGGTNTLKALQLAYQIDGVTSVLLFTDGMPGVDFLQEEGKKLPKDFNEKRKLIYTLCDKQTKLRKVPVNTIGVGHYFEEEMADFLKTVANKTGGTFIGR